MYCASQMWTISFLNIAELCSALMVIEQWEFFSVPHLLWHGPSFYNGHLRCDTHTYCQAFSSLDVTTCFKYLGLSRLGLDHTTFRLRGQRLNPLHYRRGHVCVCVCACVFIQVLYIYSFGTWLMDKTPLEQHSNNLETNHMINTLQNNYLFARHGPNTGMKSI